MPDTVFVISLFDLVHYTRICIEITDLTIPIQCRDKRIRSSLVCGTIRLAYHFDPLSAIKHFNLTGSLLYTYIAVIIDLHLSLFPLLCCYQNNTIRTTRPIDSRGRSIFQHFDRFNIGWTQFAQCHHDRNTVHDI